VQLHRDTSLQSLTVLPQLEDGQIKWLDSPLVRALTEGTVCIVDEADKAPLEVQGTGPFVQLVVVVV